MRSTFGTLWLISMLLLGATASLAADLAPDALLQRGIENYRATKYQDAASDLNAAAQAILSQDQMQKYVDTGKLENLASLETALVYLALSEAKLGHDSAAHDAVVRIVTAERIEPVYAQLPLQAEAMEFEALAKRLAPATPLPANTYLAQGGAPAGTPIQMARTTTPPAPTATAPATPPTSSASIPTQTATATPPAAAPEQPAATTTPATAVPTETAQAAPATTSNAEREREQYIERRLAEERAKLEKMFDERLAAERAALQKEAQQQIAAVQKNAQQQIEAAQKNAQQQIAAAQREADEKVAAATKEHHDHRATVREGDAAAIQGKLDAARRLYAVVANAPDAPREALAEAALGLYRTGGYRDAVKAFRRVAPFAKGEEDLRFYNAVSLYETGDFTDAKKELTCSLPYIERTDDVARYKTKIEMSGNE